MIFLILGENLRAIAGRGHRNADAGRAGVNDEHIWFMHHGHPARGFDDNPERCLVGSDE